jgi:hypothetical protein
MTNRHGIKPGDIFVSSWGYDQTNVDSYQVVRTTKAMVEVAKVRNRVVGTRVQPVRDAFVNREKTMMKRTRPTYDGEVAFKVASYADAYLWDGERTYHETYAAGGAGH